MVTRRKISHVFSMLTGPTGGATPSGVPPVGCLCDGSLVLVSYNNSTGPLQTKEGRGRRNACLDTRQASLTVRVECQAHWGYETTLAPDLEASLGRPRTSSICLTIFVLLMSLTHAHALKLRLGAATAVPGVHKAQL